MAETSKIEWTDATFNPWVGCTKVSPACDHCYAEGWAKRSGAPELWTGARRRTTDAYWRQPQKWNAESPAKHGRRTRVFCASLADVFDNQVPEQWREALFELIKSTPNLQWLLLTKRPQNIARMLPADWGWGYENVSLGVTAENQVEADRRIPLLLSWPARSYFVSCEPLLGPVDLTRLTFGATTFNALTGERHQGGVTYPTDARLNWVIAGGESGGNARPSHPDWFRSVRDQCAEAGAAFLFKQWGEWAPGECAQHPQTRTEFTASWFDDRWSFETITPRVGDELHCDDGPDVWRFGKKRAGRHLDGVEHNGFPT